MSRHLSIATFAAFAVTILAGPVLGSSGGRPNADEAAALAALRGNISGTIVWESNRTGTCELYVMNADGTNARRLTRLAEPGDALAYKSYMRPRFSPDGSLILFAYGKQHAPVECWVISSNGEEPRKLTLGNPLNWMPNGHSFLLLRSKQIWEYDIVTGEEKLTHEAKIPSATDSAGMVGEVWPDLSAGVFRFAKRNEYVILDGAKTIKTTGGCEPGLLPGGRYVYWVQGPKNFMVWDMQTDTEHQLLGTPTVQPYNYTYCPSITADGRWLLYGASPGQHSHETSDYEIFIHKLENLKAVGTPVRLTFNSRTDRWASLWPGRLGAAEGPYDVATNYRTNPPPAPVTVFSFASKDAKPDWGGEWGLWPQVEGCDAETTWVAEDAEGGKGGSMKFDYTIAADPRSFAMWFVPGKDSVDLSAHDRFVIWAKGSAPSFTLVIKDRHSSPTGENDRGVADCVLAGVNERWQRFEAPFSSFTPRVEGTRINWSAINHAGVAMIEGLNAPSGSLQVDNLRALVAGVQ